MGQSFPNSVRGELEGELLVREDVVVGALTTEGEDIFAEGDETVAAAEAWFALLLRDEFSPSTSTSLPLG